MSSEPTWEADSKYSMPVAAVVSADGEERGWLWSWRSGQSIFDCEESLVHFSYYHFVLIGSSISERGSQEITCLSLDFVVLDGGCEGRSWLCQDHN